MSGTIDFAGTLTLVSQPLDVGEIIISGVADFVDNVTATGIAGVALLIDGGGTGYFEAASEVTLGSNVTIGDAGGAGTLIVATSDFLIGSAGSTANLVIAGSSLAESVADITGAATVSGDVLLGLSAAATLELSGDLTAAAATIGIAGILSAAGNASASLGGLVDAGVLVLENHAEATASNLILTGVLDLGGQSGMGGLSSAVVGGSGSLAVGQGATFSTGELNLIGGNMSVAGVVQVAGNLLSAATITLDGGILTAAAATLSSGTLAGFGDLVLNGGTLAGRGGEIIAAGGTLVLDGNVTMSTGSLAIAAGASLDLGAAASGTVTFSGTNAELIIGNLGLDAISVAGMQGHDVIDLPGVAPSLVSYTGGVVTEQNAGGSTIGSFALSVANGQPAVAIIADGHGGALLTLGGEMACFAHGTRLLTPSGYKPVQGFAPGDPIITRAGAKKPVRWIGRRVVDIGVRAPAGCRPVIVRQNALAPGVPSRAIRLSPAHALFIEGVLVPVMHLLNGATVLPDRATGPVTYYHLELDRHELVMADGLLLETYLDTGNRGQFEHEAGTRGKATQSCAPLITGGPKLAQLRRQLHDIALNSGFTTIREPELYALAKGARHHPEMRAVRGKPVARFSLEPDAGRILLVARSAAPADTDPDSDDRRDLGICLRRPRKAAPLRLGAGWYQQAAGDAGIWMSGCGEVILPPGASTLTLHLAAVAQSWRAPPAIDFPEKRF